MTSRRDIVETYIHGKDGNRPWLMRQVFVPGAHLEMDVKASAISFPAEATGRKKITDILVRQFSRNNENVYTFCLCAPPADEADSFTCDWLVGMSCRDTGKVRVGCGRYDWTFARSGRPRATRLRIVIDAMQVLPPDHLCPVMTWLSGLAYPWCRRDAALQQMPGLKELAPVAQRLRALS